MIQSASHRASFLVFEVVMDCPSSRGRHIDLTTQLEKCQGCIIEK